MSRNYESFLRAYIKDYANNDFCPKVFHVWTGLSILSAALERRVWFDIQGTRIYPNLFIMLVAEAGIGKTSAASMGVEGILGEVDVYHLPTQITEPKLLEHMEEARRTYEYPGFPNGVVHSSAYWFCPEADVSLKPLYKGGDIKTTLNSFYDCVSKHSRGTMAGGNSYLHKVCLSLLGCCTFSQIPKILGQDGIEGGFASRTIFVAHNGVFKRSGAIKSMFSSTEEVRKKLIQDLRAIHKVCGEVTMTTETQDLYIDWFNQFDPYRQQLEDPKIKAYLSRKHVNLIKICMNLSLSNRTDMKITPAEFHMAMKLLDQVEKDIPDLVGKSYTQDNKQKQLNHTIFNVLRKFSSGLVHKDLCRELNRLNPVDPQLLNRTLAMLESSGEIEMTIRSGGKPPVYCLPSGSIMSIGKTGSEPKGGKHQYQDPG